MQKTNTLMQFSMQNLRHVFQKKGFRTVVLNSEKEVKDFINTEIPDKTKIGLGNSMTACKLNVRHLLATKGCTIFYSWDGNESYNRSLDIFEIPLGPEYYITRITALTTLGEILIKDYNKNAAGRDKFPMHTIAFAGLNRLVEELEDMESIVKYPVIRNCPKDIEFTIALLPFLDY